MKKDFRVDIRINEHDFIPEVDLREELKNRLQLNIIDGELFDKIIECFENGASVQQLCSSILFTENLK